MAISSSEFGTAARLRRHTGAVAAMVALVSFAAGAYGAYRFLDKPQRAPILLRQATEPVLMSAYDVAPGSGGVLVLVRNDGTTTVDVIDAAFSRTSAAPPLYIAPESVPPGGEANLYVPVPGACYQNMSAITPGEVFAPVRITVSAREGDGPIQFVPVEVTGALAQIMISCGK